uniref:Uncharacterized protein n=1 Tax=Oryza sativa subsp. japonica TaxID=39947 RepID=Q6Z7W2_ORYSJ|nr:hypothetical protein [Oryza sativa Japonica Group]
MSYSPPHLLPPSPSPLSPSLSSPFSSLQAPRLMGSRGGPAVAAGDATVTAAGELHLSAQPCSHACF